MCHNTVLHLTGKGLLEDELVWEEEGEVGREGFGPDVESQEADGEVDGALAVEPDAGARHGVNVHLDLDPHGLGHPESLFRYPKTPKSYDYWSKVLMSFGDSCDKQHFHRSVIRNRVS